MFLMLFPPPQHSLFDQISGMFLSPPTQLWDSKHSPPHLAFYTEAGDQTRVCSASALPTELPPQPAQVENMHKHGLSPIRLPWGWSQSVAEMHLVWYLLFNKCTPSPGAGVKYNHKRPSMQKPLGPVLHLTQAGPRDRH